ncbi:hypothetical protein [Pedobacter jeongneungensis]|uniref:hypothetical protein n=1 Tax=Pedobacter jeongneungensis TaxID=947309 RepID=UPI000468696F|nr:hypothetical protein [Pedobacter jeongneungensis]
MKNRLLLKIVLLSLMLTVQLVSAQEFKGNTPPLYKYLQNSTDSALVLTYDQIPDYPVTHFILSKKLDLITLYLYGSPYDRRGVKEIPREIRNLFQKRDLEINRLKIDTNAYFNAKYIIPKKAKELWKKTIAFHPWQMADDAIDGEGCPNLRVQGDYGIYDGGSIRLFLITKDTIRRLYFYAPAFYDKKCPGRLGRKSILKIEQLFKIYFDKN